MSETGLKLAQDKMAAAGIAQQAIDVFTYYYRQLEEGVSGFIPEATIEPLVDPPMLSDVAVSEADAAAALERAVIIKLNGGLGTSMEWTKPSHCYRCARARHSSTSLLIRYAMRVRRTGSRSRCSS